MSPAMESESLCPDWVLSTASNVHLAKSRGWFSDYVPFKSTVGSLLGDVEMKVEGIGTVELPTKRTLNASGTRSHATLRLVEVLHVPTALCNVVGQPNHNEYRTISMGQARGIYGFDGERIACFDLRHGLALIKLSGPPVGPVVGPHVLQHGKDYCINVHWSDAERRKWQAHQKAMASSNAAYTSEEKSWLKKNYKSEFHFLRMYGLSIYDEEDREEGRTIVRAMMKEDNENGLEESEADEVDSEDEIVDSEEDDVDSDDELDLESHMVDYLFTEAELEFIDESFDNAVNFMRTYGLKFYDQDDCEEAKTIVRALMSD